MKKIIIGLLQVAGLTLFSLVINAITPLLHIPIPGSILGMVILFLLLEFGVIRLNFCGGGGGASFFSL